MSVSLCLSQGHLNIRGLWKTLQPPKVTKVREEPSQLCPEFLEHLRLDIAAADDCYVLFCVREFSRVKDESGCRNCATRLGYGFGILAQVLHRFADFFFRDRDDVVHIGTDVLEVDRPDALRAKTIGNRAADLLGGELNNLALAQAGLGVGREFGFDADDLYFRIAQFDGGSDTGDEAS